MTSESRTAQNPPKRVSSRHQVTQYSVINLGEKYMYRTSTSYDCFLLLCIYCTAVTSLTPCTCNRMSCSLSSRELLSRVESLVLRNNAGNSRWIERCQQNLSWPRKLRATESSRLPRVTDLTFVFIISLQVCACARLHRF